MPTLARTFVLCLALPASALAQTEGARYPDKPLRVIVPYAAGSSTDIVARVVGQKLAETLGQPVIADNRPGAGGNIAADFVARSSPDGYTLLVANNGLAISPALYRKLSYDPAKDLAPIAQLSAMPHVLVVRPLPELRTVRDLIGLATSKPGELTFASSGTGASDHMAGELFKAMATLRITHVPYKGGPPALADVIGGQVTMYFSGLPSALPHVKSGRLRALAVSTRARAKVLPDVPSMDEAGVPGYEVVLWYASYAPAQTPRAIVGRLSREIVRALQSADVREKFAGIGVDPSGSTPEELAALLGAELVKWARVIEGAGIKLDGQ